MRKQLSHFLTLVVAMTIAVGLSWAQSGTGRVTGSIKDTEGNVIAGAKISVEVQSRMLEDISDDDGRWGLLGFRNGSYTFSAEANGFVAYTWQAPVKQRGRNPSMEIVLERESTASTGGGGSPILMEANQHYEAKEYPEALAKYTEALAAEPNLYQINLMIGNVYRDMGDSAKAKEHYQMILDIDATYAGALISMGDLYIQEADYDNAIVYFEQAVEQTTDAMVPFNVGEIYFNKQEAAKAIGFYQRASDLKPDWADPHLRMGYAHLNGGDMAAARTSFEKVVALAPDTPQAQAAQAALDTLP